MDAVTSQEITRVRDESLGVVWSVYLTSLPPRPNVFIFRCLSIVQRCATFALFTVAIHG